MRILHVSKFREVTGGVERHMHDLTELQERAGHATDIFSSEFRGSAVNLEPKSATTGGALRTTAQVLWSEDARRALSRRIRAFAPDILHYHSIYHQLSVSVLHARSGAIPTVMTLHDYKLAAPCYVLLRDGRPCTDCVGAAFPWPAVRHRCIKESRAASLVCATEQMLHQRVYRTRVDRFIAPSRFAATILSGARAVPTSHVSVVPHGITSPAAAAEPSRSRRFVYIGRLSREKGLADLLRAWEASDAERLGCRLEIVGDGPDAGLLDTAPSSVVHRGWLDEAGVAAALATARCAVVPSRSYETFGLAAAEALAAGVPVIAARSGAIGELVDASGGGSLFGTGDTAELTRLITKFASVDAERQLDALGAAGRAFVMRELRPSVMLERTMDVYQEAARSNGRTLA